MAMLAETKRKTRFILQPVSTPLWAKEGSNDHYGKKLMEKMGWTAGKGLGANEQGICEPVRAVFKQDAKGVGFKGDGNPFYNQDEFNALLSSLAAGDTNGPSDTSFESLEEKSMKSKARVHYKKFTRGKDISRYSSIDLACIVGSGKKKEAEVEEEKEEISKAGEVDKAFGVTTIHGGSIADYFKMKWKTINGTQPTKTDENSHVDDDSQDYSESTKSKKNERCRTMVTDTPASSYAESVVAEESYLKREKGDYELATFHYLEQNFLDGKKKREKKSKISNLNCIVSLNESALDLKLRGHDRVSEEKEIAKETRRYKKSKRRDAKISEENVFEVTNSCLKSEKHNKKRAFSIEEAIVDESEGTLGSKKHKKKRKQEKDNVFEEIKVKGEGEESYCDEKNPLTQGKGNGYVSKETFRTLHKKTRKQDETCDIEAIVAENTDKYMEEANAATSIDSVKDLTEKNKSKKNKKGKQKQNSEEENVSVPNITEVDFGVTLEKTNFKIDQHEVKKKKKERKQNASGCFKDTNNGGIELAESICGASSGLGKDIEDDSKRLHLTSEEKKQKKHGKRKQLDFPEMERSTTAVVRESDEKRNQKRNSLTARCVGDKYSETFSGIRKERKTKKSKDKICTEDENVGGPNQETSVSTCEIEESYGTCEIKEEKRKRKKDKTNHDNYQIDDLKNVSTKLKYQEGDFSERVGNVKKGRKTEENTGNETSSQEENKVDATAIAQQFPGSTLDQVHGYGAGK